MNTRKALRDMQEDARLYEWRHKKLPLHVIEAEKSLSEGMNEGSPKVSSSGEDGYMRIHGVEKTRWIGFGVNPRNDLEYRLLHDSEISSWKVLTENKNPRIEVIIKTFFVDNHREIETNFFGPNKVLYSSIKEIIPVSKDLAQLISQMQESINSAPQDRKLWAGMYAGIADTKDYTFVSFKF